MIFHEVTYVWLRMKEDLSEQWRVSKRSEHVNLVVLTGFDLWCHSNKDLNASTRFHIARWGKSLWHEPQFSQTNFWERIYSCGINWPLYSPDRTSPEFLKGVKFCRQKAFPKEKLLVDKSQTNNWREKIQTDLKALEPETVKALIENVLKRAFCEAENGHHLKEV